MALTSYLEIISGSRQTLATHVMRFGLWLLSWGYCLAVSLRNALYSLGCFKQHKAAVPVISIGNITTGGTGKTPVVAYLANWLQNQEVKVGILSRGYYSLDDGDNDEKRMLDQLCPGIPHLQNPDRVTSAQQAISEHNCQLLLLDDGFQHSRLQRDVNIVLIDAVNPFGYGHLLPRGLLRERLSGLKRADLVIITRVNQVDDRAKQQIIQKLASVRGTDEHMEVCFPPSQLVNSVGERCPLGQFPSQNVAAFCGIGNPEGFRQTLASAGLQVGMFQAFPDHHHYTSDELSTIAQMAHAANADCLLTTSKDLVKIPHTDVEGIPLWAIAIGVEITAGAELLTAELNNFVS